MTTFTNYPALPCIIAGWALFGLGVGIGLCLLVTWYERHMPPTSAKQIEHPRG